MGRIVVLLGLPGAGKGTQARELAGMLGVPQISTGDMLREIARPDTTLGREVRSIQERGELVDDETLARVVRERTIQEDCARGYILDGYPRTAGQAETLCEIAKEQGHRLQVIQIQVSASILKRRLSGRMLCPSCGEIFHSEFRPPNQPGKCDVSGHPLVQRADDRPESVEKRFRVYEAQTASVVEHYRELGELEVVNGEQEPAQVLRELSALLTGVGNSG